MNHSAEIISKPDQPKTDAEIDSWILSQYKGGIRRLKIYNDISDYKFGEKGNFNIWFFANNPNEATGIVINHWTGNQFSLRLETKNGPIKIQNMSSPDNTEWLTILEQGTYNLNTEYTPVNDPRKCIIFAGIIGWDDVSTIKKNWHDSDNWYISPVSVLLTADRLTIKRVKMLINNHTGNVKFIEMHQNNIYNNNIEFLSPASFDGIAIYGKQI